MYEKHLTPGAIVNCISDELKNDVNVQYFDRVTGSHRAQQLFKEFKLTFEGTAVDLLAKWRMMYLLDEPNRILQNLSLYHKKKEKKTVKMTVKMTVTMNI